jgi:crotonobetainyl-CoA:carnitine CoA-transferase CaiB-like acyl-CoA transferase
MMTAARHELGGGSMSMAMPEQDKPAAVGPLAGVRVLDLTSLILGPYATQMLGDLGADVIKIESPDGDSTRHTGPGRSGDMASLFLAVNRNKRSVILDLKQPAARDALLRMADAADVFVHNIRPQKLEKLGLGSKVLLARNPRLIYAGLHGWRENGPYSGRPAYDDIIQGLCGMASLMDDLTGQPRYVPTILADKTCGIMAVQGILAALFHRERTGRGQFVEVPMFETMVSFLMVEHLYGRTFDPPEGPTGYSRVVAPWRRPYRTADGYVCMMAYTDQQWLRFWSALGKPEMMQDPRFVDMPSRTRNIEEVYRIAGEQLEGRTTREWIAWLDELEIPSGPVKSLDEVLDDPHLAAVDFFKRINHPTEGGIVMPDTPLQFSGSPAAIRRLPPKFGEHGHEVLREFGLTAAEIDALAAAGGTIIQHATAKASEPVS